MRRRFRSASTRVNELGEGQRQHLYLDVAPGQISEMLLKLKSSFTFGSIITPQRKRSQEPISKDIGQNVCVSVGRCLQEESPAPSRPAWQARGYQNRGDKRVLRKRKALSRLRACSLLGEPLSDRIGRQWRFSNARSTRALARYGCSTHGRDVYPSHLAASFSTVPSSWSFLMASLMALVSSGLSLFTATAYSSPVATSRTTWASL